MSLKTCPKVELHVHLEGAIPIWLIKKLAEKNKVPLASTIFEGEVLQYTDFFDFMHVYDQVSRVLKEPDDVTELTYEYLKQSAKEHVIYTELTVSPSHGLALGFSYHDYIDAIKKGIQKAEKKLNVDARILIMLIRQEPLNESKKLLNTVIDQNDDYVVGINLAGDEVNYPPNLFTQLFKQARASGLQCTAHAGEWRGSEGVQEALDELQITRIGHGVRAIEDKQLVQRLLNENIHLELCLSSNIELGVYKDINSHPILDYHKQGINFSLNSDAPPFFKTTMGNEYKIATRLLNLNPLELRRISEQTIKASFAPPHIRTKFLERLEASSNA